ncbi:hypothetical protein DRH14_03735 [Candidatus Shapirobacteria bacterium]|nr:MAG: hypothetical protein DRH14_03735 [Candidatus Shapirobacteria bacterium]
MTKVQLSLTDQEANILGSYGSQFGYNLAKTIRFFISKASEEILKKTMPVYQMSQKTEEKGLKALDEYRKGKAIKVEDVEEFFDLL